MTAGEGFSSQGQRPLYFGLGDVGRVEKAVIRWPSGIVQVFENPEININHNVKEEE